MRQVVNGLLACLTVMAVFLLLRGGTFEANYGFDLARGELPPEYLSRLWLNPGDVLLKTLLVFGACWLGIMAWRILTRDWTLLALWFAYQPLVMLATIALSSRITRVEGAPLVAVVIPAFVLWVTSPPNPLSVRRGGTREG